MVVLTFTQNIKRIKMYPFLVHLCLVSYFFGVKPLLAQFCELKKYRCIIDEYYKTTEQSSYHKLNTFHKYFCFVYWVPHVIKMFSSYWLFNFINL